jgi:hypothetical protein
MGPMVRGIPPSLVCRCLLYVWNFVCECPSQLLELYLIFERLISVLSVAKPQTSVQHRTECVCRRQASQLHYF